LADYPRAGQQEDFYSERFFLPRLVVIASDKVVLDQQRGLADYQRAGQQEDFYSEHFLLPRPYSF
jgi:hypothetical protein